MPESPENQDRFDALVEEAIGNLPPGIRALLDEVPVIVEDQPSRKLIEELKAEGVTPEDVLPEEEAEDLCGLHTGTAFTERSIETTGMFPSGIYLFRRGIVAQAGGWDPVENESDQDVDDSIYEEIMVTLLHEIGHQFGLSEDDLKRLGYD
jgi:predicted Zn-dependent protease with MMP-like domain